jgi:hypothetical protein
MPDEIKTETIEVKASREPEINFSVKIFEAGPPIHAVPEGLTKEEATLGSNYPRHEDGEIDVGPPLTEEDAIGPGDLILVPTIVGGWSVMEVRFSEDSDSLFATNDVHMAPLNFNEDERHCWTTPGMFNMRALQNLEISHG